jgi:hypothetical protein
LRPIVPANLPFLGLFLIGGSSVALWEKALESEVLGSNYSCVIPKTCAYGIFLTLSEPKVLHLLHRGVPKRVKGEWRI